MAKRLLKCFYCGQTFDANAEEFVQVNSRRYAHKACAVEAEERKSKEEKDKERLENYIKGLFDIDELTPKIRKQINTYRTERKFSYSGIYKTLKYWFEVRNGSLDKANGGIGIVDYVYDEALLYWRAIWEAQQQNQDIKIEDYVLPAREVRIPPPKREPMKHCRKLFSFLEEEVDEE